MEILVDHDFKDHHGRGVEDVNAYVTRWMEQHPAGEVYIGADSKVRGNYVQYATVICLRDVGRGVYELCCKCRLPKPKDPYARLWKEVTLAVDVALQLKSIPNITIHVDFNSNPRFRSHALYDASMGFIMSMGYSASGKPDSWAASCGAHRHCQ